MRNNRQYIRHAGNCGGCMKTKKLTLIALRQLNNELETSNNLKRRELAWKQEYAEKELEVKDRVDISLKEYNEMKSKIKMLEIENASLNDLFNKIHLGDYLRYIDFDNIKVRQGSDVDPIDKYILIRVGLKDEL